MTEQKLFTTQEFTHILTEAYKIKGDSRLGEALWNLSRLGGEYFDRLYNFLADSEEEGYYLYTWENDCAVLQFCLDTFVETYL